MKGDWIQTFSGGQIWPLDLAIERIKIQDIAHALSSLCRYTGHVRQFYSVAEHCCHVSDVLPAEWKLEGLLHDASEAYLCDLPRPLKHLPEFAFYREIEQKAEQVIAEKFRINYPMSPCVKSIDNLMLSAEAEVLMSPVHPGWKLPIGSIDSVSIQCWLPQQAEREFLSRYQKLA